MSIGVIQGTTATNEIVQVVFEAYYKSDISSLQELANNLTSNLTGSNFSLFRSNTNFKLLTLDNFQRAAEGRWATHEIIGTDKKPLKEFLGPGLEKITFSIFLSVGLGITPETELTKLRTLRDSGVVCDFVLGSAPVTSNSWVITSLSEAHQLKDNSGQTVQAVVNVSMEEYVKKATTNG
ncbi:phage protein U [Sporomusaceae bacterium BoRhaA]|uniref:phage tail protein n=1 Tax=Pelorhabdus rhamnosifermentans TaxID=2772457 RepID=UPI001C05F545|nr:phage tail protein [Pelorhabdus rhamnosifermentans]MBU2701693.1 phage protein U [Pelorhabdus rhamnosifermentans]